MKIQVTIEAEVVIEFDENSEEFKEIFDGYNSAICECDYEEFAGNIASIIARYGADEFIEGVGRLKINGNKQIDYFSRKGIVPIDNPVNIIADTDLNDKIDFQISYTQFL